MSKSKYLLLSSFLAQFERVIKWVGRSKYISDLNLNMVESVCLYRDCFYTKNLSYTERLSTETHA